MKRKSISESDIKRIINKILREDENVDSTDNDLPKCVDLMKNPNPGSVGGSISLMLSGKVELSYNGSVSPQYQGTKVIVNGKPFCFIPKR